MDDIEQFFQAGRQHDMLEDSAIYSGIDVTAQVLQSLQSRRQQYKSGLQLNSLAVAAILSCLVAVSSAFVAGHVLIDAQNPLAAIVSPFQITLQ